MAQWTVTDGVTVTASFPAWFPVCFIGAWVAIALLLAHMSGWPRLAAAFRSALVSL